MKIALVAGESSGDLLGAGLIKALRNLFPDAEFEGVAGPAMVAAGCRQIEPSDSLAVFGLIEPLRHLPRLLRLRRDLVQRWTEDPPDVFIGIDAPDFNLGLEKRLKSRSIRTVHYVSPSVWAWRAGRVKTVKAAADHVLCILPFEPEIYEAAGVAATFVGHPKADSIPDIVDRQAARAALGVSEGDVVAVLPGSRNSEIAMLGETLVEAAAEIAVHKPHTQFITPVASGKLRPAIEAAIEQAGMSDRFLLLDGDSERAMIAADVVLLASGTAALESALLERPTVAAYRLGRITYAIVMGLGLLKLEYFTLPNLLTETPLLPEFMQDNARPDAIAAEVISLLDDAERRQSIAKRFARLKTELAQNTDRRAAETVAALIQ